MTVDYNDFIIVRENSKSTRKRYKTWCDSCDIETGYKRRGEIKTGLCRSCFGKTVLKDREFSEETKTKMSISAIKRTRYTGVFKHSEETKQVLSKAQKDYCSKHGNQFVTGKSNGVHTKETISVISIKNLGKEPKWKGRVFQYVGPKGRFKMRSSYELAYAEFLDSKKIGWTYEPKFTLSNGMGYCPDFKLEDGSIVEVKGYWTEKALAKWELFKKDNSQLTTRVIMKNDLIELNLEVV